METAPYIEQPVVALALEHTPELVRLEADEYQGGEDEGGEEDEPHVAAEGLCPVEYTLPEGHLRMHLWHEWCSHRNHREWGGFDALQRQASQSREMAADEAARQCMHPEAPRTHRGRLWARPDHSITICLRNLRRNRAEQPLHRTAAATNISA